ncbi:MAG TPA: hypothetical protein ENH40_02440 [Nitrospirae bacterium]|nr:hypothetical protein [Nitrospirota bacterium]
MDNESPVWFDSLLEGEDLEDVQKAMQEVLLRTETGRKVFTFLLCECGWFREIRTDEERILNNFAKRLLYYADIIRPGKEVELINHLELFTRSGINA